MNLREKEIVFLGLTSLLQIPYNEIPFADKLPQFFSLVLRLIQDIRTAKGEEVIHKLPTPKPKSDNDNSNNRVARRNRNNLNNNDDLDGEFRIIENDNNNYNRDVDNYVDSDSDSSAYTSDFEQFDTEFLSRFRRKSYEFVRKHSIVDVDKFIILNEIDESVFFASCAQSKFKKIYNI